MMTIRVEIVSAQAKIYSGKAELVVVPAALGEMGIAPRHAPLMTKLKPGTVRLLGADSAASSASPEGSVSSTSPLPRAGEGSGVRDPGLHNPSEEVFYVQGGLIEVQPYLVTILADVALRADDLDEAAALAVKKQVEAALSAPQSDFNYSQAMAELAQAVAQIHTINQLRKKLKVNHKYD
jgi:F-type H+-transporting ATPase subunit epsilon